MEVKDVKFEYPAQGLMKVTITVFEGIQYMVGKVDFERQHGLHSSRSCAIAGASRSSRWTRGRSMRRWPYVPEKEGPGELSRLWPHWRATSSASAIFIGFEGATLKWRSRPSARRTSRAARWTSSTTSPRTRQSYVEQIIIQGNNRTKDKVIRRELLVAPGQIYDSVRADVSKKRLGNLQYFEKVDILPRRTRRCRTARTWSSRWRKSAAGRSRSARASVRSTSLLGFRRNHPGQFRSLQLPVLHRRRRKIPGAPPVRLWSGRTRKSSSRSRGSSGMSAVAGLQSFLSQCDVSLGSYYNERNYGASVSLARAFRRVLGPGSITYTLQEYDLYEFSQQRVGAVGHRGRWELQSPDDLCERVSQRQFHHPRHEL